MFRFYFQEVNVAASIARERLIAPINQRDIIHGQHRTQAFDHSVVAFGRSFLPNPDLCTVTWRSKGKPLSPMLVSRAGEEPVEEFGLIHVSQDETPLEIRYPTTRELAARIISIADVNSTATPPKSP